MCYIYVIRCLILNASELENLSTNKTKLHSFTTAAIYINNMFCVRSYKKNASH